MSPSTIKGTPMPTETIERTEPERPPEPPEYQPPRLRYIGIALAALLASVGLYALFGGGSGEPDRPAGVENLAFVDGTLAVVEQNRLVMRTFQPLEGESEVTFSIAPQDQGNFDIAHLQSHSSVAIPTRIYYRKQGGTLFAVYKEDAPANSSPAP